MAFTAIILQSPTGSEGLKRCNLYLSHEYLPHKERDESGEVLPNQKWQHPDPAELHYCEIGTLAGDDRALRLIDLMLDLGIERLGGHGRILTLDACPWLDGRLETWADRQIRVEKEQAEREAEEERRRYEDEMERAPVYGYCERCERETEQCKGPSHRGSNRCMACCGGLADSGHRHCGNCLDLPYREAREKLSGERIAYAGEEPGL